MARPLRIFLCCQQDLGTRHPVPAYDFWAGYFRAACAEAGHECLEAPGCDWAAGLVARPAVEHAAWLESTWSRALDWLKREHTRQPVDWFLGYLFPTQVLSGALAELRAVGIPSVNFFCDHVRLFRRVPGEFRSFDLHWVPEAAALPLYARAGLPALAAPMACWVPPAYRTLPDRETLPPTFVGTRDETRERLFAAAFALGLEADLRGHGWDGAVGAPSPRGQGGRAVLNQWNYARQHGTAAAARKILRTVFPPVSVKFDFAPRVRPMPGADYWLVLRESRVCLGVNRFPSLRFPLDRPGAYSRLRDIEAPMTGACYLTEWAPGLDQLYDPGREIEVYRDAAELVEKCRALDRDPARRAALRAAGQRRALTDHTIARTLERIADHLGCVR